jgi:hypothetical protein
VHVIHLPKEDGRGDMDALTSLTRLELCLGEGVELSEQEIDLAMVVDEDVMGSDGILIDFGNRGLAPRVENAGGDRKQLALQHQDCGLVQLRDPLLVADRVSSIVPSIVSSTMSSIVSSTMSSIVSFIVSFIAWFMAWFVAWFIVRFRRGIELRRIGREGVQECGVGERERWKYFYVAISYAWALSERAACVGKMFHCEVEVGSCELISRSRRNGKRSAGRCGAPSAKRQLNQ